MHVYGRIKTLAMIILIYKVLTKKLVQLCLMNKNLFLLRNTKSMFL